jgi:putative flippase GtrA
VNAGWSNSVPNADQMARLARYGVSGGLSAGAHFTVALAAAGLLGLPPVPASTTGFVASIAVSYLLQRSWVFRTGESHAVTGPRFLTVTAAAFALNTTVLAVGTGLLGAPFLLVQAVAILLIPALNYAVNVRWTFA